MKRWWLLGCVLIMSMSGTAGAGKHEAPAKAAENAKPKAAEQPPGAGSQDDAEAAAAESAEPAPKVEHIVGPRQVDLGHHAQIDLPAGMVLLEAQAAQELMRKSGNSPDGVVTVIFPASDTARWWVCIEASDGGYVSDGDADELDADTLLNQIKQGTLQQNKTRVSIGVPEYFVDDWRDPPRYQRFQHHLVWGINGHDTRGKNVNFSTRFLGRNSYLSVDLIDGVDTIEQSKVQALAILTAVHFMPGFRYEDHADGDHDSGIGLKTLVVGGTAVVLAKKGGILIAILLALKKGIVVIVLAVGAFLKRLFGRKKPEASFATTSTEPPEPRAPSPSSSSDLDPPTAG